MANLASYIMAGLAVVLAIDYFNPIVSGPGPLGAANAEPATAISTQVVDRSHKGDRLDRPAQAVVMVRGFDPIEARPVRLSAARFAGSIDPGQEVLPLRKI